MDNLKVLVTKEEEESRIRKLSINGEVFEFFYFDSLKLILDLTTNLLTIPLILTILSPWGKF